jgi:hypothetical protein
VHDLDAHDRLEQHRLGHLGGLLEGHLTGDLERHLRGVDVVVLPVDQRRFDVDRGVAGEHAGIERLLHALVGRVDVLARDLAAADLVDELVALAGFGSSVILTTANWPEPPDCLMWRYSTDSTILVMVSR